MKLFRMFTYNAQRVGFKAANTIMTWPFVFKELTAPPVEGRYNKESMLLQIACCESFCLFLAYLTVSTAQIGPTRITDANEAQPLRRFDVGQA
jgi:hypothetical protein